VTCQDGAKYDHSVNTRPFGEVLKHIKNPSTFGDILTGCNNNKIKFNTRILIPFTIPIHTNHSCVANEMIALMNRHLISQQANRSVERILTIRRAFELLARKYPPRLLQPITQLEVIRAKKPDKRKQYIQAYESLQTTPLTERDSTIKMFIKYERMNYKEQLKAPRAIQSRGVRFNLVLQQWIIPYAKYLTRTIDIDRRFSTKGLDQYQLAALLFDMYTSFRNTVVDLFDHRYYDSSTDDLWLNGMHEYIGAHFAFDPELMRLLEKLKSGKCQSANGLKYNVDGCVFSGDVTTGDGNSTANQAFLCDVTRNLQLCYTPDCGDDSCVFHDADDDDMDLENLSIYGYSTKHSRVYSFPEVEYCQCHPINTINGWLMVREPMRLISRATVCIENYTGDQLRDWYAGVGLCELSCNAGVPVLQSFARFLMRCSSKPMYNIGRDFEYHRIKGNFSDVITDEARVTFYQAFKMDVSTQLELERYFDRARISWSNTSEQLLPTYPTMVIPYDYDV